MSALSCEHCGKVFPRPSKFGRTPSYCSRTCQVAALHKRQTKAGRALIAAGGGHPPGTPETPDRHVSGGTP